MDLILENKWSFKTVIDNVEVSSLSEKLNIHPVMTNLLFQRGIENFEAARTFFRPSLDSLHDPWLMKDMQKAVDRIEKAIENKEKIMILGDYDVDGTTATALAYRFLSHLNAILEFYIPDRYAEGYGISFQSIDYAASADVALIISLDCGIKAIGKVSYANEKNIDFIICDHHTPGIKLPEAVAILDPKRKDCSYPYDSLSGCGVGFKLIQALAGRYDVSSEIVFESLDLLATSIAADIVPITGENRILTWFGLDKLNKNPSAGIAAIKDIAGKKKDYTISDVVFKIAPRINSAGRMSSGKKIVDILITENLKDARYRVEEVNVFNEKRRDTDKNITKDAFDQIINDEDFEHRRTTVLYDSSWHKGVIGIVASRMIEKYYRPTIIFTGSDGILSGSARSVKKFDLYAALEKCSDLLIQFGGHKYAAGMTLKEEDYNLFKDKFNEVVSGMIREEHLQPIIEIDAHLLLSDINNSFYKILRQFAPFGPGNMNPVFCSENVAIRDFRVLVDRNENKHLKFKVFHPSDEKRIFDVIGFGMGNKYDDLDDGVLIDLLYNIEENVWNGRTSLQLVAKDLRIC